MNHDKHKKFERRRRHKKFEDRPQHKKKDGEHRARARFERRGHPSSFMDEEGERGHDDALFLRTKFGNDDFRSLVMQSQARLRGLVQGAGGGPSGSEARSAGEAAVPPLLQPSRSYISQSKPVREPKRDFSDFKLSGAVAKTEKKSVAPSPTQLDPWQREALDALLRGANVIVDAPTSAGKTRVIEAYAEKILADNAPLRLVYTTPVKSLSNDKYREFCERYGKEKIGINTGDFKENLGAPIVIATLETYRNSLLGIEPNLKRAVIVYDEYHYLQDEGRGSAWEESIILTPKESQLLLLSASVPNTDDFGDWLTQLHAKECKIIKVTERPVPLVDVVYVEGGWVLAKDLKLADDDFSEIRRSARGFRPRRRAERSNFSELMLPVSKALELGLGPIVIYAGRRADAETIAHSFARYLRGDYQGAEAEKLRERIEDLEGWEYVPHDLQRLVRRFGVAYHHSGMIPPGRVAIETLLKEGLLRVCCGTMGISLGVNFAVRSALISDESRPGEGGEMRYSNSEVLQMLGRAGRRGRDKQGFSLWMNLSRYAQQRPREREPTRSSLKFDPTTVLSLLGQYENLAYLSEFYRKSFFMRGKDPHQVYIEDHDLLYANLYKKGFDEIACDNISDAYTVYLKSRDRQKTLCAKCPARVECHGVMESARGSALQSIVHHLQKVDAVEGPVPTRFGQLARFFPQSGGLIIAKFLADGVMTADNFFQFTEVMASFCAAHFKNIPDLHCDSEFIASLKLPKLIEKYYPQKLFPELYDTEVFKGPRAGQDVFREFNPGAASLVTAWRNTKTSWERLVRDHSSRHFSAGDCMMVLFRFSTFLQSCIRLRETHPQISRKAQELLSILLREPLDARNRMVADEVEEFDNSETESGNPDNVTGVEPGDG